MARRNRAAGDGAEVLVEITGLATGGEGVGRQVGGSHDGRAVFVALTAPGELVRARVMRQKARVAWATLMGVERASSQRVTPPCPLFGRCGGCQWQHASLEVQREAKRRIVERALGVAVTEVRAAGPEWGYRDRARLVVGDGRRAVGFRGWRSHAVVDVPACPLLSPALAAALPSLRAEGARCAPGTEIAVQAGGDGRVVARFGARGPVRAYGGAGARPVGDAAHAADEPEVDVSEPGGPPLRIGAGAFAQVGAAANAALVAAVLEQAGEQPGRVLELHAGSGNFTRHLVGRSSAVVASDGDPRAVARGRRQVPGARWVDDPVALAREMGPFDTVVVDPPREGLDADHLALVAAAARRRLVYVSCDPQTLGRDAARLVEHGLRLAHVVALDLMPQTFHVEVVASFDRA
jgi:23S rRNA (uracil1939-C5)-methyltransferase